MSTHELRTTESPRTNEEGGGAVVSKKAPATTARRYTIAPRGTRPIFYGLLAFILLMGVIALILYLVYRPSKPRFNVVSAAVFELNATASDVAAATISTSMQFTLRIRNPNKRSSVSYDRLSAYVGYRDQAITAAAPLPPLYQEANSAVAVSPVLGGGGPVPVSPGVVVGLRTDQTYGMVRLRLVLTGRLRYKAGPFRSAWHGLFVRCDLVTGLKEGKYGQVPMLGTPGCAVDT